MHSVKNILVLRFNFDADSLALFAQLLLQVDELDFAFRRLGEQNHVEESVQDILIDAENVDVVVGEDFGDGSDYADAVSTDDRYD